MRTSLVALAIGLATVEAHADEPVDVSGIWYVSAIQTHGTCETLMQGTVKTVLLSIAVASDNTVVAETIRQHKKDPEPVFPRLVGTWDPATNTLDLTGQHTPDRNVDPALWYRLQHEDGKLHGVRRFLGANRLPERPEGVSGAYFACFIDSEVTATREK